MFVLKAVVLAAAFALGATTPTSGGPPAGNRDPKQVQILENYSVFSIFNASKPATAAGPGLSPDSLIRFLDTKRSV